MPKSTPWCVAVALLAALPVRPEAQTYTCLPDTATQVQILRDYLVGVVTGTDSTSVATRTAYHLPAVAASKITVVTSASVCHQAGDAYHAAITDPGTPAGSRTLVVIKVSTSRYVVLDLNQRMGEFELHYVFDSKWSPLVAFGS